MRSIKAHDRELEVWYKRIKDGEIKLPRFQRYEAWDRHRISSLLSNVIHNLPLGVTLILEIDDEEFISRYIKTAEKSEPFPRVIEQLLDGQQRLTSIWRALHNNYPNETYFLYLNEFDKVWENSDDLEDDSEEEKIKVIFQTRWVSKKEQLMPLWADSPLDCLKRGCIPMKLFRPEDISSEIDTWIEEALIEKKPVSGSETYEREIQDYFSIKSKVHELISEFRETVKNYNLPFLALPSDTNKDTALNVFINMNTNSKPLSQYDIIVAEIEGLKDTSLHDLQDSLNEKFPDVQNYFDLSYQILYTSALIQDKLPNKKGIWEMDKKLLVDNWDEMENGLNRMAIFLQSQRIYDKQRLPTNAILAVIAALYTHIPETGDLSGKWTVLMKKYLWSAFFTDRYENSAASRAFADYMGLKNMVQGNSKDDGTEFSENDIPVLNRGRYSLAEEEELINVGWPKQETIRGRGILAVADYFGALDFADGSVLSKINVSQRHYHHIYPDALIEEAKVHFPEEIFSYRALNCALITNTTNLSIGRKDPLTYLMDRYKWANENIVQQRLLSHLIPIQELKAGGYEGLNESEKAVKIKSDYEHFLARRAKWVSEAVKKLVEGEELDSSQILELEKSNPI
jgi:hypothetical protein